MTIDIFKNICQHLSSLIKDSKFETHTYCVGGCVRDMLLNHSIKDIDLVVSLPNGGIELAKFLYNNGHLVYEPVIYATYGTAMFKLKAFPDNDIEVVQTRKEQYKNKNSRNPETCFGTIKEDALRRDLTINSLYFDIQTEKVLDLTENGLNDLKNSVIRTPCEPNITFIDDPLRICRVIRFAARYKWKINDDTWQAMLNNIDRLSIISIERIREEFNQILCCNHNTYGIEMLMQCGAMKYIIPELFDTVELTQNKYHFGTVFEHTIKALNVNCIDRHQYLPVVLALLLHDIGKIYCKTKDDKGNVHFYKHEIISVQISKDILKRLKYSNALIEEVCFYIENHMCTKQWGDNCEKMKPKSLYKLQYKCKTKERFENLLYVIDADNKSHHPDFCLYKQVRNIRFISHITEIGGYAMFNYKMPINGNDIKKIFFIEEGKMIKKCLDICLKFCFSNPLITKEQIIKQLKGFIKTINTF